MRVGIFTDTYTPFINGVTTSVLMLKKGLERQGHTVYIVTVSPDTLKYKYEENGKVIRIPGVPTWIYDYRLTGIYPLRAIKRIKKWKLDVIHSQTEFGIGTFARIIAKQLNIPLVHTYHTMYEDYVHYITKGLFDKSSKKIVEYLTLFYCDRTITELIVPTKKAFELFKDKYLVDRSVYIVPTGIDTEKFYIENNKKFNIKKKRKELNIDVDDFVLLSVSRIGKEKNIDLLLSSMNEIIEKNNKIKLLIVGDGPDLEEYKKYASDNNLNDYVIFTGKVPWDTIQEYYLLSNVFVTASTSETQGLTVIEAMSASLPVICIDDDSFKETVNHRVNGLVFKEEKGYIRYVLEISSNEKLYNKLRVQARDSSNMHSIKFFADKVIEVYNIAIKNYPKTRIPLIEKLIELINKK